MRKTSHPKSLKQVIKPDMTGVGGVHLFFSKILPYKGWFRKFIPFLLIAFILLITTTAQAAWYDSNWQYRKAITHNGSKNSDGQHIDDPDRLQVVTSDATSPTQRTHEIVFVDPRLPDRDDLIVGLTAQTEGGRHFELIILDVTCDGIDLNVPCYSSIAGNVFEDVNGGKKLNVEAGTRANKTTGKSNTYATAIEQAKSPVNLTDGEAQF